MVSLIYPIYKSHLDPVRLLHFLALAVLVSRFIPRDWHGMIKPWTVAMIRCGENSLPIYCFSVLLSFLAFVFLKQVSGGLAMQAAASAVGIGLIVAAASFLTWKPSSTAAGRSCFRRHSAQIEMSWRATGLMPCSGAPEHHSCRR